MNEAAHSNADRLYELLPELYRSRDETGDLRAYVAACGEVLDGLRQTLLQRYADGFPDAPSPLTQASSPPVSQSWLLPYFARLLEEPLASTQPTAQRREIAGAINWRRRKGSIGATQELAAAILDAEVTAVEGWRTLAVTPRLSHVPQSLTPALPVPAVARGSLTPDTRTPSARGGQAHPKRLVLSYPAPAGFFSRKAPRLTWKEALEPATGAAAIVEHRVGDALTYASRTEQPVLVTDAVKAPADVAVAFAHIGFLAGLDVSSATTTELRHCAVSTLVSSGTEDRLGPDVSAYGSLIGRIDAPGRHLQLEYVTLLGSASAATIWASDCIAAGEITTSQSPERRPSLLRYARAVVGSASGRVRAFRTTTEHVPFVSRRFGEPACGVLHPAAGAAIARGAEDGGELGAFHDHQHCALRAALAQKLHHCLPFDVEPVIVFDEYRQIEDPSL